MSVGPTAPPSAAASARGQAVSVGPSAPPSAAASGHGQAARRGSRLVAGVTAALAWLVLAPVHLYRTLVSPLKRAPTCRFVPTCSQYAIDAVKTRGVVVGIGLAVWRVCRCNPFGGSGLDPVPPRCAHGAQEVELH